RHFGRYGEFRDGAGKRKGRVFITSYSNPRQLISWVLGLGEHARLLGPPELVEEARRRVALLTELHDGEAELPELTDAPAAVPAVVAEPNGRREPAIRPERFARLVTLASILIEAGRDGRQLDAAELCERLQISAEELREDVQVLNVVNFGAGSYILYAEVSEEGQIEVDPDAYSDSFARPARLLPIEAKALVAAIDLIGEHIPKGSLASTREKIVAALGEDPIQEGLQVASAAGDDSKIARVVSRAISGHRLLEMEYYKENEDELTKRRVEPYALMNGREGWYVASFDPSRDSVRHFRL